MFRGLKSVKPIHSHGGENDFGMNAPAPKRELMVVCLTSWGFESFECRDEVEGKIVARHYASFKWWIVDSKGIIVRSSDDEQD